MGRTDSGLDQRSRAVSSRAHTAADAVARRGVRWTPHAVPNASRHRAGKAHRPDNASPAGAQPAYQRGIRASATVGRASHDQEHPRGPIGLRVLIAEDDAPVRAHAVRLIGGLGYVVRAAGDGHEALRLLVADSRCDILFTDVTMPGMRGGELAQAARRIVSDLPVVFTTGHHDDPVVMRVQREGRSLILLKPYRRQAVAAALRDVLRRREDS